MSFEDVAVQEEIATTPPGTSGQEQWLNIAGSESHHMYAWPRRIQGPSEVAEVFQQQLESGNSKPFSIEARCVECNEACAPVKTSMTLTSDKWTGQKPGYTSRPTVEQHISS